MRVPMSHLGAGPNNFQMYSAASSCVSAVIRYFPTPISYDIAPSDQMSVSRPYVAFTAADFPLKADEQIKGSGA